jgi:hypothetical protein
MTDLVVPITVRAPRNYSRVVSTIAIGLVGGCALGIAARAWMRLISEDPEFTWSGTIFIVVAFTIFGFTQSIATAARGLARRRWVVSVARIIGAVGLLPLFVGAGALMLPTVVFGGLAAARPDWSRVTRVVCAIIAAGPVVIVGRQLVDSFGWSVHTLAGFLALLAIYGTVIRAARATFATRTDGWHIPRIIVGIGLVALALFSVFFVVGVASA